MATSCFRTKGLIPPQNRQQWAVELARKHITRDWLRCLQGSPGFDTLRTRNRLEGGGLEGREEEVNHAVCRAAGRLASETAERCCQPWPPGKPGWSSGLQRDPSVRDTTKNRRVLLSVGRGLWVSGPEQLSLPRREKCQHKGQAPAPCFPNGRRMRRGNEGQILIFSNTRKKKKKKNEVC